MSVQSVVTHHARQVPELAEELSTLVRTSIEKVLKERFNDLGYNYEDVNLEELKIVENGDGSIKYYFRNFLMLKYESVVDPPHLFKFKIHM